jgi:hypothetical protein
MYTSTEKKMDRTTAITTLKKRHEDTFKRLGIYSPYFALKLPYARKGKSECVVGFFPSELSAGDDIYLELTDGDYNPIYTEPVLYRLRFNPFFKTEYEMVMPDPTKPKSSERYLVNFAELELVSGNPKEHPLAGRTPQAVPQMSTFVVSSTPVAELADCHYNELTARDWACIHLKVPDSGKKWLNDIIIKSKTDR